MPTKAPNVGFHFWHENKTAWEVFLLENYNHDCYSNSILRSKPYGGRSWRLFKWSEVRSLRTWLLSPSQFLSPPLFLFKASISCRTLRTLKRSGWFLFQSEVSISCYKKGRVVHIASGLKGNLMARKAQINEAFSTRGIIWYLSWMTSGCIFEIRFAGA